MDDKIELQNIEGVEIFSVGIWNGDPYTNEDLDEMIRAFDENKATLKPFLKLGHNQEQKLIQNDGLPAAGWIDNLRREGEKLVADFVNLPKKIFQLIERGAYKKVSSEIYWNVDFNGKVYKRMLSAVALLGANMPAVSSLDDILDLYGIKDYDALKNYAKPENGITVKLYDISDKETGEENNMDELEKLQAELKAANDARDAADAAKREFELKVSDSEKELDQLRAEKAEIEKAKLDSEKVAFVKELESEKLITPAMKPYIQALMVQDAKEYSIEDKKLSKFELIKQVLKLHTATDVNLDDNSEAGKGVVDGEAAILAKIETYAKDHNVSYGTAHRAILKENSKDDNDDEENEEE